MGRAVYFLKMFNIFVFFPTILHQIKISNVWFVCYFSNSIRKSFLLNAYGENECEKYFHNQGI